MADPEGNQFCVLKSDAERAAMAPPLDVDGSADGRTDGKADGRADGKVDGRTDDQPETPKLT